MVKGSGQRYEQLRQVLSQMLDGFGSPIGSIFLFYRFLQKDWGPWSPWGRFLRLRQQVDGLLYAEIADRRNQPNPNRTDILALLMTARDSFGQPLSDIELRFGINYAAICWARNDGICLGLGAVLDSLPT